NHQDQRLGRTQRPVARGAELEGDQIADDEMVAAAQDEGRDIGADGGNENQQTAGDDPRLGQRNNDPPQDPAAGGVEIEAGLDQAKVHLLEAGIERQYHERQETVEQAQHDGEVGVEHDDRLIDHAEPYQKIVDQPFVADGEHDGQGAHQQVGPEGNGDEEDPEDALRGRARLHEIGGGKSQRQADDRGRGGEQDGAQKDDEIVGRESQRPVEYVALKQEGDISLGREDPLYATVIAGLEEGIDDHDQQRQDAEQPNNDEGRGDEAVARFQPAAAQESLGRNRALRGRRDVDRRPAQSCSMRAAPAGTSMPTLSPTAKGARPSTAFCTRTFRRRLSANRTS